MTATRQAETRGSGRRFGARAQTWLGVALGLAALYLAARGLDFGQVGQSLAGVRWPYVLLSLVVYLLTQIVKAIRWRWLLAGLPARVSLARAAGLLVAGQAANLLLPARVGDLMRAYLAGEEAGISKIYLLGTIAGEKLLDLVALALLGLLLAALMALPAWLAGPTEAVVITALATAAACGLLVAGRRLWLAAVSRLLPRWSERWRQRLAAGIDGLAALAAPGARLAVGWWTLVAWLLAAVTNLVLFPAFNLPPAARPALFLLAVLQAGVAVPSSPGKIGVFHALCVLALGAFGVAGPVALGYGVVLHAIVVGSSSLWAALALWRRSWGLRRNWALDL